MRVITGRNTFAAASLFTASLAARTAVTIVGEPMGGSPHLFGNARDFLLTFSGIGITVATEYVQPVEGDLRVELLPDRPVPLHLADFLAGRDPALAAIEGCVRSRAAGRCGRGDLDRSCRRRIRGPWLRQSAA